MSTFPKAVNVVSFSIPYPPNYGGIIDVFYQLKALHATGIKIYLHCFQYDRQPASELNEYCAQVFYYKRKTDLVNNLSHTPYIVKSRSNKELLNNLLKNDYPIIFEGLHSCFFLTDKLLQNRLKIYRACNIEHEYYRHLAASSSKIKDKLFYIIESKKLKHYQKFLRYTDAMLTVSTKDYDYLKRTFPDNKVVCMPCFHCNNSITSHTGRGSYALYHGNLSVEENIDAVKYLINNVFSKTDIDFVVAGLKPTDEIRDLIYRSRRVRLVPNPDEETMRELITDAHVNVLYTNQATGLKLKLLNVLYQGRFVLANSKMCAGTELEKVCLIADCDEDMIKGLDDLFEKPFTREYITLREQVLEEHYNNRKNLQTLLDVLEY